MFSSIITTTDTTISAGTALLGVAAAALLGLFIALCYMKTEKKGNYSKDFVTAMVLLPPIVAVVIMLVGSNVARAFSLAGAFALVRFRSAPGSAKDIAVVFLAMSAGLACGLGFVVLAAVMTVVIVLVMYVLAKCHFGEYENKNKLLKVTIPEDLNYNGLFEDLFSEYTNTHKMIKVRTTNMGTLYELSYEVELKADADEKQFIDSIRCRNGNLNIILGMIPDSKEGVGL